MVWVLAAVAVPRHIDSATTHSDLCLPSPAALTSSIWGRRFPSQQWAHHSQDLWSEAHWEDLSALLWRHDNSFSFLQRIFSCLEQQPPSLLVKFIFMAPDFIPLTYLHAVHTTTTPLQETNNSKGRGKLLIGLSLSVVFLIIPSNLSSGSSFVIQDC